MNKKELEQIMKASIEELESSLAVLKKEMAALQEVEKPAKWEPKGGSFSLFHDGHVTGPYDCVYQDSIKGIEFASCEAAESAKDARIFFQRMQCLAAELNPSGKVSGTWGLEYGFVVGWYMINLENRWTPCLMFETKESAQQAADIFNRDEVKPPIYS